MKTYTLAISPAVYDDLTEIRSYITEILANPDSARAIIRDILDAIRTLSQFPLRGTKLKVPVPVSMTYRFIPCHKYLIFYRMADEDTVFVARVLLRNRNHWQLILQDDISTDENNASPRLE